MEMYSNKLILAPMVRIGTLPVRLLSLKYGADLVYSEEIVDLKILQSQRRVNDELGTVEYFLSDGSMVFQTLKEEKYYVIFQMGTSDPERALKAAKMVENDVAGIDINMGCPKKFSIEGGMGAALLTEPDKVKAILTTLVDNLKIPVTCKIRILPKLEDTLSLIKVIESTGVKAIGVHGRTKEERSSNPCQDNIIKTIAESSSLPIIANGGSLVINSYDDIIKFKSTTGASSVMVARAAQWNPSVFRKDGCLPVIDVIAEFVKLAVTYGNNFSNTKYISCKMMRDTAKNEIGQKLISSKIFEDLCDVLDLNEFYENHLKQIELRNNKVEKNGDEPPSKRLKPNSDGVIEMDIIFNRNLYPKTNNPKTALHLYLRQQYIELPVYDMEMTPGGRLYKCVMTLDGKKYTPTTWSKSKKFAEQAAALVYLNLHGMDDGRNRKKT